MSYDSLIKKVRQAEQALEARERAASANWRVAKASWKDAWTPGRIAVVGAIAGFMFGRSRRRPVRAESQGISLVRLAASIVGLMSSMQAKSAAAEAEEVAESAEALAGGATKTATPTQASDRRVPDPVFDAAPRAAEAATEVSEPWAQRR